LDLFCAPFFIPKRFGRVSLPLFVHLS
jgi:hypothetical protein